MQELLNYYLELSEVFERNGFHLYLVGGTVRDFLLRKPLSDMDAVTDAKPDEMKTFLNDYKTDFTFAKYGSIKLKINDGKFDITTLRKETAYFDSRHPDKIEFVKDLKIDVKRRDFTVNALYLDKNFKLLDFVDGENDLNSGVLRMVGEPNKRLKEDPLRIIRAIRFSLTYNLKIENSLENAIRNNIGLLENLNIDKIKQDIHKIECDDKNKIKEMFTRFGMTNLVNVID